MHVGMKMAAYMGIRASRELELVSHNLANSSTVGFKRELLNLWRLAPSGAWPADLEEPAAYVDVRSRDLGQGALHETGNDTDLALQGPGYFKVQTPRGVRYTRHGTFHLSPQSQLVTKEGYQVLGKNGPITLDARDQKFTIDEQGGIHLDNNLGDQILVVEFPNPQDLLPEGQTYFLPGPQAGEEIEAKNTRVIQGNVEESNVDLMAETLALIDLQRRFESYMKVLETFAASDRKVVEEIGQIT
jgi:flagellar basal-body rod protein FlgF